MRQKSLVFLIHGFMGHPGEFEPIIETLEESGYDTHRVCLPQHGDDPGKLSLVDWTDLLAHCQEELQYCQERYDTIHLLGFSLGGALSMVLSHQNPDAFQSMTLVAAPCRSVFNLEFGQYHVRNFFKRFMPGLQYWSQRNTGFPKPSFYPLDMIKLYSQMEGLFTQVKVAASSTSIPTLLLHSPYDLTVPYEHSEWLFDTIPGPSNFVTLLSGGHQVFPFNTKGVVERAILHHLHHHNGTAVLEKVTSEAVA